MSANEIVDLGGLRALGTNREYLGIFLEMVTSQNRNKTNLYQYFYRRLAPHKGTAREVTFKSYEALFRKLQELGIGELRGNIFRWFFSMQSVANVAMGHAEKLHSLVVSWEEIRELSCFVAGLPSDAKPKGPSPITQSMSLVTYNFPLRPGCTVKIELPNDLSADEAKRFAHFVRSISFETSFSDNDDIKPESREAKEQRG